MEIDVQRAAQVLEEDPAPALPLDRLGRLLARRQGDPESSNGELLESLRGRPDLFRILDPWRGPWRPLLEAVASDPAGYARVFDPWRVNPPAPWVVATPLAAAILRDEVEEGSSTRRSDGASRRSRRTRWPRARPPGTPVASADFGTPGSRRGVGDHGDRGHHSRGKGASRGFRDHRPGTPALRLLRESTRWFALTVDTDSTAAVARWTRIASQEAEIREMMTGAASHPNGSGTGRSPT